MEPLIRLKDVMDEMDVFGDNYRAFLNIRTGELVTLSEDELSAAEGGKEADNFLGWDQEIFQKAVEVVSTEDYLELPGKFDIHEYAIMEDFCYAVEDDALSRRLLNSIRGRGAFRYFKDTIREYGVEDDWYQFRDQAFKRIAIDWLESHDIAYIDDEA